MHKRRREQIREECKRQHKAHEWQLAKGQYLLALASIKYWTQGLLIISIPVAIAWYVLYTL